MLGGNGGIATKVGKGKGGQGMGKVGVKRKAYCMTSPP